MRAPIKLASALFALTAAACSSGNQDAAADDFQRDLQLASATTMATAAPAVDPSLLKFENAPTGAPEEAPTIRKAPEGDHAVPSETPTVEATPEPEPAPVDETKPEIEAPAPAPVPVESNEPVASAPRQAPVPAMPAGGRGAGDYGTGGGVIGGGVGVVIRGGGVGDGDHCEIRPRRGGVIFTSPVYRPTVGGTRPTIVRVGGR